MPGCIAILGDWAAAPDDRGGSKPLAPGPETPGPWSGLTGFDPLPFAGLEVCPAPFLDAEAERTLQPWPGVALHGAPLLQTRVCSPVGGLGAVGRDTFWCRLSH